MMKRDTTKLTLVQNNKRKSANMNQKGAIHSRIAIIRCNNCGNVGDKGLFQAEVYTRVKLKVEPIKDEKGIIIPGRYDAVGMSYAVGDDVDEIVTKCLVCGSEDIEILPVKDC